MVLPAVEAIQLLANSVHTVRPEMDIMHMTDARFEKFLYIDHEEKEITAFSDLTVHTNGDIAAALST